jgi:DNA repair ATPase RecN
VVFSIKLLAFALVLLIDMHGQNEHQLLLRNNQQRDLLDAYAQSPELCDTLNTIVSQYSCKLIYNNVI